MSSSVGNLTVRTTPYQLAGELGARHTTRYSSVRLYIFAISKGEGLLIPVNTRPQAEPLRLCHLPYQDYSESDLGSWHKPLSTLAREELLKVVDDYPSSVETKSKDLLHVFTTSDPKQACAVVVCRFRQEFPPEDYVWCETSQIKALSEDSKITKSPEMAQILGAYRRWTVRNPVPVAPSMGGRLKKQVSGVFESIGRGLKKMGSKATLRRGSTDDGT